MPVYRDARNGRWRYRTRATDAAGNVHRIGGTPKINTKKAAEAAERKHIERIERSDTATLNASSQPERERVPTVKEYTVEFLRLYPTLHKPSVRREKRRILENMIIPHFGEMRLDEIRQSDIDRFVVACAGKKPKTINNRLTVLSTLLRYAARNGIISTPRERFTVPVPDSELVAVSMPDVAKLLGKATPVLRLAILLATEAGLRAGEIRGLQWTDIRDGEIRIRRALDTDSGEAVPPKHNKHRTVPVSESLSAELASAPKKGLWVLARDSGDPLLHRNDLYLPLVSLYTAAKVPRPPSPIHCLRHTFGTEMASAGVPLPVLKELMGHASVKTTMRYVHVNERQKREAIAQAFGQHMANAKKNPR